VDAYREIAPPPALQALVACVWVSHGGATSVLPDGCVDVVLSGERLVVAGPATEAVVAEETPGLHRVGVRFRVGVAGAALGLPVAELRDRGVGLDELWGAEARRVEERVKGAVTRKDALLALIGGLAPRLPRPEDLDHEVRRAVVAIARGEDPVERAGLSERQLRRRFESEVGYGPATLARVLRFQRFLRAAEVGPEESLARLAAEAGYADQAHLAREAKRLSGTSPSALLQNGAGPAGDVRFVQGA
jgi:AraC-like DNA-binding protein